MCLLSEDIRFNVFFRCLFSPPEDFFYEIQLYRMLDYFQEETNRNEDLALTYLQNRAPSTPISFVFLFYFVLQESTLRSQDTSEYAHQNRIFFKQISGWFKASFTWIIRVKNMRFQKCSWGKKLNPTINWTISRGKGPSRRRTIIHTDLGRLKWYTINWKGSV